MYAFASIFLSKAACFVKPWCYIKSISVLKGWLVEDVNIPVKKKLPPMDIGCSWLMDLPKD
jgi:hypothetical protein